MIQYRDGRGGADGSDGPDPILSRTLGTLDPVRRDPGYWLRFHSRVIRAAGRELARRRMLADMTVPDLLVSWGRALVPTAMLAAAAGAFVLFRSQAPEPVLPVGVEEQLAEGIDGAPIPVVLTSEDQPDAGGVIFASEAY